MHFAFPEWAMNLSAETTKYLTKQFFSSRCSVYSIYFLFCKGTWKTMYVTVNHLDKRVSGDMKEITNLVDSDCYIIHYTVILEYARVYKYSERTLMYMATMTWQVCLSNIKSPGNLIKKFKFAPRHSHSKTVFSVQYNSKNVEYDSII